MTLVCFPSVSVWTSQQHQHNVKQTVNRPRSSAHKLLFLKNKQTVASRADSAQRSIS